MHHFLSAQLIALRIGYHEVHSGCSFIFLKLNDLTNMCHETDIRLL